MGCDEARMLLDAYVDGELSAQQQEALMAHVNACEACKEEFAAAMLLRDCLKDMDEDVAVPLEAQAAWRTAVRAEAKKKSARRWSRVASIAAVMLVLVVGMGFVTMDDAPEQAHVPQTLSLKAAGGELIAADGPESGVAVVSAADAGENWSARKKFAAADVAAACETIEMLAEEYSGSCTSKQDGASVLCRVELPYDYMADFLSAAGCIGTELDSETVDAPAETAVILIQIDLE